jgi:hypothetical protein
MSKKKNNLVNVVKIPFKRCSEENPQTFDEGVSIQLFINPSMEITKKCNFFKVLSDNNEDIYHIFKDTDCIKLLCCQDEKVFKINPDMWDNCIDIFYKMIEESVQLNPHWFSMYLDSNLPENERMDFKGGFILMNNDLLNGGCE